MAAPTTIPSHHIKGEVAPNRPAYREGRLPKATKVYTVNQESVYLLVQGVPALGTSQELIQLFAVYGAIQEYRILDEYPTSDRYHDVYLIKFQKIQAARFAKKKLDDYSFYGGVLHISYAPEFESVEETRDKLQERRRNIASRIRLLGKETQKKTPEEPRTEGIQHEYNKKIDENPQIQTYNPTNSNHHRVPLVPTTRLPIPEPDPSLGSYNQIPHTDPNNGVIPPPEPCYHIPPPPKQDYRINPKFHEKRNYEFARVPSAHATLPKEMTMSEQNSANCFQEQINKLDSKETRADKQPCDIYRHDESDKPSEVKTIDGLIVRNVPKHRSIPKFVPRQTLTFAKSQPKEEKEKTPEVDKIREELQQNAFLLGKKQGPRAKVEEEKSEPTDGDRSVSRTVTQIRKRVKEVFESGTLERKEKQRKIEEKT